MNRPIRLLPEPVVEAGRVTIEHVGGPLRRQRRELDDPPEIFVLPVFVLPDGRYLRSVRCADDGALRYVWHRTAESGR